MDNDFWKEHGLRRSPCREAVIRLFESHHRALSDRELRDGVGDAFDRTTLYRTLRTLEEANVIHRIVANSDLVKYALNDPLCPPDAHAHFVCEQCDGVWCLTQIEPAKYILKRGFEAHSTECLVRGTCSECLAEFQAPKPT